MIRERLDALVEDGDEQRVLARKMAIEGGVREARFGEDIRDPGLEVSGSLDHHEGRVDQRPDLVFGGGASLRQGAIDDLSSD